MLLIDGSRNIKVSAQKSIEIGIPSVINQEIPFEDISRLIGIFSLLGLGFTGLNEKFGKLSIRPSSKIGFIRLRFQVDEGKYLFSDIENFKALWIAGYLLNAVKNRNGVFCAFEDYRLLLTRGNTGYKLRISYKDSEKVLKLSKEDKAKFTGLLKSMVFGRYLSRKIALTLQKGIVILEEDFRTENTTERKVFREKIENLWVNILEKGGFPAITIRENLRKKGVPFKSFIRIKGGYSFNEEKVLTAFPLHFVWGFATASEVL